jgi:hypothetical protein
MVPRGLVSDYFRLADTRPELTLNLAPGRIQWLSDPIDGIHRYFCAGVAISFWYEAARVPLLLAIGSRVG